MDQTGFDVIFRQLVPATKDEDDRREIFLLSETLRTEAEGIDELRRLSVAIAEPRPPSFTTT